MKAKVKFMLLMTILGCFLLGNMTILAAESDFYEVPNEQTKLHVETEESIVPLSDPTLAGCRLGIGVASNGLSITFVTSASEVADEIGVKNVVLQEKTWYGWKDIPASNYYTNNSSTYVGEIVYKNAEAGKTYRAYCTHYAKYGSTELTLYNITNNFVYK